MKISTKNNLTKVLVAVTISPFILSSGFSQDSTNSTANNVTNSASTNAPESSVPSSKNSEVPSAVHIGMTTDSLHNIWGKPTETIKNLETFRDKSGIERNLRYNESTHNVEVIAYAKPAGMNLAPLNDQEITKSLKDFEDKESGDKTWALVVDNKDQKVWESKNERAIYNKEDCMLMIRKK
jgi:hypothetical protein